MRKHGIYLLALLVIGSTLTGCVVKDWLFTGVQDQTDTEAAVATESTEAISTEEVTEMHEPEPTDEPPQTTILTRREVGTLQTLFGYEKDSRYSIHYPLFEKEKLDAFMKTTVEKWAQDFSMKGKLSSDSTHEADLRIEYDSYLLNDRYVTVLFWQNEIDSHMAHPEVRWDTFYFDLQEDKVLERKDLLPDDALSQISEAARKYFETDPTYRDIPKDDWFEAGIAPKPENYQRISFMKEGIQVRFEPYQILSGNFGSPVVTIPKEDLNGIALYDPPQTEPPATEAPATEATEPQATEPPETEAPQTEATTNADEKRIALTFDDGPTPEVTTRILKALSASNGQATFFVVGNRVESNPDIVRAVRDQGSEVANHSYSHADLTKLAKADLDAQIGYADTAIANAIGTTPTLLRPPYGAYDKDVVGAAGKPIILWSIDTLDWKTRDADQTFEAVLSNAQDGDIVLMHDLYESTAAAAERIIPALAEKGFRMVTVSELMKAKGLSFDSGTIVNSAR